MSEGQEDGTGEKVLEIKELLARITVQLRKTEQHEEMTYDGIRILSDGTMQLGELVKNPNYVSGMTRTVLEFIYDLIPTLL